MLLLSLLLSVEISDMVSLPLSLHCCSSPKMKTGVHLKTSPEGIEWVAVALLAIELADDSITTNSVLEENFCARLSMLRLKVSLRSGLRPMRSAGLATLMSLIAAPNAATPSITLFPHFSTFSQDGLGFGELDVSVGTFSSSRSSGVVSVTSAEHGSGMEGICTSGLVNEVNQECCRHSVTVKRLL